MKPTFILLSLIAWVSLAFINPEKQANIVSDFKLKNINGKIVSLGDYKNAKGFIIVFTCNHCPFAKMYPQRMNLLNNKFARLGVPLIAISSSDTMVYEEDSYPEMVKMAKQKNINFPFLYDATQSVAKQFKADKTPHAFVIWKENKNWVIKYQGAIDDNGSEPEKVTHTYVADAVNALLNGNRVPVPETKSIGCAIKWRK
jgi:peroxiredoxin